MSSSDVIDLSKLLRPPSLTDQVFQILLDRIYNGTYPPGAKLPNEDEFIKEFSISRVTLRSAYAKLEEHHLIQRRQGAGTYVVARDDSIRLRYKVTGFGDWITRQGYRANFNQLDARVIPANETISSKLCIDAGSISLRLEKVWTANGQPVIHHICYLPHWIFEGRFTENEITQPGFTEPFFQFLKQRCNARLDYLISSILPDTFDHCDLPQIFSGIVANTPLLVIEDLGFTAEGTPVFYSIGHFFGIASKIETLRSVL
jgi:GntR family transcriptional regulator